MQVVSGIVRRAKRLYDETVVSDVARRVRREKLTYLTPEKMRRLEQSVSKDLSKGVKGDVLEFGVALGGSAIMLSRLAVKHKREFHGFDVFGMIPAPGERDEADVHKRYETIKSGKSEGIDGEDYYGYRQDLLSDVTASFRRYGLEANNDLIRLHKGLFQETWSEFSRPTIAAVHIDCDWYDPVKFCLAAADQRLSSGGIVIIDDYYDYSGCRQAVDEFLAGNQGYQANWGKNVILTRL